MGILQLETKAEKLKILLDDFATSMDAILPGSSWEYLHRRDEVHYNEILDKISAGEARFATGGDLAVLRNDLAAVYRLAGNVGEKLRGEPEKRQVAHIHILSKELGWCRADYEDELALVSGRRSSKELSWAEAELVKDDMKKLLHEAEQRMER